MRGKQRDAGRHLSTRRLEPRAGWVGSRPSRHRRATTSAAPMDAHMFNGSRLLGKGLCEVQDLFAVRACLHGASELCIGDDGTSQPSKAGDQRLVTHGGPPLYLAASGNHGGGTRSELRLRLEPPAECRFRSCRPLISDDAGRGNGRRAGHGGFYAGVAGMGKWPIIHAPSFGMEWVAAAGRVDPVGVSPGTFPRPASGVPRGRSKNGPQWLWACGQRAALSKGCGQGGQRTALSPLSMARHVHSLPRAQWGRRSRRGADLTPVWAHEG